MTRGWRLACTIGCVGVLLAGCGARTAEPPAGPDTSQTGPVQAGDARAALLAALQKTDGLDTYRGEMTMPQSDLGQAGTLATSSRLEVSVRANTIYLVTETTGGPIGTSRTESLTRGNEYLVRGDVYRQALGGDDPSITDQTWFRAPADMANPGTLMVSMFFAPAGQAITDVPRRDPRTIRGTEVSVYHAELDAAKFHAALAGAPGVDPAILDKLPSPSAVDYGVGDDGYVHGIEFSAQNSPIPVSIELFDYNAALALPDPVDARPMPK